MLKKDLNCLLCEGKGSKQLTMYKKKGSKLLTMYTVQEKDLNCLLCTG